MSIAMAVQRFHHHGCCCPFWIGCFLQSPRGESDTQRCNRDDSNEHRTDYRRQQSLHWLDILVNKWRIHLDMQTPFPHRIDSTLCANLTPTLLTLGSRDLPLPIYRVASRVRNPIDLLDCVLYLTYPLVLLCLSWPNSEQNRRRSVSVGTTFSKN